MPEQFAFAIELPITIAQINRGDHLGNHEIVAMLNEASTRFFIERELRQYSVDNNIMLINADLAVQYLSEARYGEAIRMSLAAQNFHRCGFDVIYSLTDVASGREVARAKTAHLLLDRESGKTLSEPKGYFDGIRQ